MMKAMIVYDSKWGNTENIAKAISIGLGSGTKAVRVGSPSSNEYDKVDLLVVGSPILGGRPSEAIQRYINEIPQTISKRLKAATFDTRLASKFVKIFGFAAVRMAGQLKEKGFTLCLQPEGFIVNSRSGPLADGEIERATQWGKELSKL